MERTTLKGPFVPPRWLCNVLLKVELDAARMQSILAMYKLGYHPTSKECVCESLCS